MIIDIGKLVVDLVPERTVLFLGAGASLPSHGPSAKVLIEHFSHKFSISPDGLSLAEVATLAEKQGGRKAVIAALRSQFENSAPAGGLLNLPHYDWKTIFTTNYDTLVEKSYQRHRVPLTTISSNFDYSSEETPNAAKLFKLHGSLDKDTSDGYQASLVLTLADYDATADYREHLYDRLKTDIAGAHLVVIGHSMQDPDITEIIQRAVKIRAVHGGNFKLTMLAFDRDENRAALLSSRGFDVCFAGINEFFDALSSKLPETRPVYSDALNALEKQRSLIPVTIDVAHAYEGNPDVAAMFNGSPATYADVRSGLTFPRTVAQQIVGQIKAGLQFVVMLGASGIGKTTTSRQCAVNFLDAGYSCWEHQPDYQLQVSAWRAVAKEQENAKKDSFLIIDEAHQHLHQINDLIELLVTDGVKRFRILAISTRRLWWARIKTPALLKQGKLFHIRSLDVNEIDALLNLVDTNQVLRSLIVDPFQGFSSAERRRRLRVHCESDTFVCLKSIFASEKFDDIILREFAELPSESQDIYRLISAMESIGVQVHRQMVMRLIGIESSDIPAVLKNLEDIIHEISVNEREGIFAWRGRHPVIAGIVTRYKFSDKDELIALLHRVVDNIQPTYEIEIRTLRELCDPTTGIGRITDKSKQNVLLRKMMSIAPGERVPRHRLIHNLIKMGEHDQAETEIRIFCKDFRLDGVVARFKIMLQVARATKTEGLLKEDRETILRDAADLVTSLIDRFPQAVKLVTAYCEVGVEFFRLTGSHEIIDAAVAESKAAEARTGDPEVTKLVGRYVRLLNVH